MGNCSCGDVEIDEHRRLLRDNDRDRSYASHRRDSVDHYSRSPSPDYRDPKRRRSRSPPDRGRYSNDYSPERRRDSGERDRYDREHDNKRIRRYSSDSENERGSGNDSYYSPRLQRSRSDSDDEFKRRGDYTRGRERSDEDRTDSERERSKTSGKDDAADRDFIDEEESCSSPRRDTKIDEDVYNFGMRTPSSKPQWDEGTETASTKTKKTRANLREARLRQKEEQERKEKEEREEEERERRDKERQERERVEKEKKAEGQKRFDRGKQNRFDDVLAKTYSPGFIPNIRDDKGKHKNTRQLYVEEEEEIARPQRQQSPACKKKEEKKDGSKGGSILDRVPMERKENLSHLTKSRPMATKKRAPTRDHLKRPRGSTIGESGSRSQINQRDDEEEEDEERIEYVHQHPPLASSAPSTSPSVKTRPQSNYHNNTNNRQENNNNNNNNKNSLSDSRGPVKGGVALFPTGTAGFNPAELRSSLKKVANTPMTGQKQTAEPSTVKDLLAERQRLRKERNGHK